MNRVVLAAAWVLIAGFSCTEEVSTIVRLELLFPEGDDPLDRADQLRVTVIGDDGELHEHELALPAGGWNELDAGISLGLVDYRSARILVEGIDLTGEVTCAGETLPLPLRSGVPARVRVFVQTLGTSGLAPPLTPADEAELNAMWDHGAAYLPAGGVILAGGPESEPSHQTWVYALDLYEPIALTWLVDTGGEVEARALAAVAPAGEDRALIWGGVRERQDALVLDALENRAEAFELPGELRGRWPRPAWDSLVDGDVITIRDRSLWRLSAAPSARLMGELDVAVEPVTLTLVSSDLVVVTSSRDPFVVGADPLDDGRTVALPQPPAGPRSGHSVAALSDGRLVLIGGEGDDGPIEDVEVLAEGDEAWRVLPGLVEGLGRTGATLSVLDDDRLVLAGGLDAEGEPWGNALVLDLDGETVAEIELALPRVGHTATVLPTGVVMLAGGLTAGGAPLDAVELLRPPARSD